MSVSDKLYHSILDASQIQNIEERVIQVLERKSELDPYVKQLACNSIDELPNHVRIQFGYKILHTDNIKVNSGNINVSDDITFECSNIIAAQLRGIEGLVLFAATLGRSFDNWLKGLFESNEPLEGYIVDLIGSVTVESAADILEVTINNFLLEHNFSCSNRYSPGYCDWNVSEQKKLFSFLPNNFCGIHLTESSLMIPIKSVSGIIGFGRNVSKKEYACKICTQENCYMNNLKAV